MDLAAALPDLGQASIVPICGSIGLFVGGTIGLLRGGTFDAAERVAFIGTLVGTGVGFASYLATLMVGVT